MRPPWFIIGRTAWPPCRVAPVTSTLGSRTPERRLALAAIRIYKMHLSPRKGFNCAYRTHLGRFSCSTLGYRAVRRFGVLKGFAVLRQRTALCARTGSDFYFSRLEAQRGSAPCDIPCDGSCIPDCDLPDVNCRSVNRYFSCCDGCSGDWPERRKKPKNRAERFVPPPRQRVQRQ